MKNLTRISFESFTHKSLSHEDTIARILDDSKISKIWTLSSLNFHNNKTENGEKNFETEDNQ